MPEPAKRVDWTDAYVDDLPDSAFLYIEPRGYKDAQGKTMPRTCRHFPYRDADGAIDFPHLDRAIDRIPKSAAPGLNDAKKAALVEQAQKLRAAGPEEGEEEAAEKEAGFFTRCVNTVRQMTPQQLALSAVLLIAIVVAVIFLAKSTGIVPSKITPPDATLNQKQTKIDMNAPYKEVTLTFGEWQKLGPDKEGRFKNPETKEYTMVDPTACVSCKQWVPEAQYPDSILSMPAGNPKEEAKVNYRNGYKCPKCGKLAYAHEDY